MKLKLPNTTFNLDADIPMESRVEVINEVLNTVLEFQEQQMTVEEYFRMSWDNPQTVVCMDIIGYYLTKENKDLSVLSNHRRREMENGSERHTTFSGMGMENQLATGVLDADDYNY